MKTSVYLVFAVMALWVQQKPVIETAKNPGANRTATHEVTDSLVPHHSGVKVKLHTFKVDGEGRIVAGVSTKDGAKHLLQFYSSQRNLEVEIRLDFPPTAIAIGTDGRFFAAGNGQIAVLDPQRKISSTLATPNYTKDELEKTRQKIVSSTLASFEQTTRSYHRQLKVVQDQIHKLEQKKDKDKWRKRDSFRLKALKNQKLQYEELIAEQTSPQVSEALIDQALASRLHVPSLAIANDGRLFVTTTSDFGYQIWRLDQALGNPVKVLDNLRGCCGQLDIHVKGDHILAAENTRFKVGIYDLDGKFTSSFGERLNSRNHGFAGCCNPMNLVCDGPAIITAESSVGIIKRFDADGKFLQLIGKADIGSGCKHVAIGYQKKLDTYLIQYEDENRICVLTAKTSK